MSHERRLAELGIALPDAPAAVAVYVPVVRTGNHLHVSGQIPWDEAGELMCGTLGAGWNVQQGQAAARRCALAVIAQVRRAAGSLDAVEQIVKLGVFVASTPGFTDQPKVANGASELMVDVFGEAGRHARSAVGVAALPLGVAVEVDAIVALRD